MNIVRFTNNDGQVRYRVLLPGEHSDYDGQTVVVRPQDLLDIMDHVLREAATLRQEAYNEEMDRRNQLIVENVPKPWLPLQRDE